MQPGTRDITFTRGDDYQHEFTFVDDSTPPNPLFWTDMTFAAQIRRFEDDAVLVSFTVDASGIGSGVLIVTLTDTQTATLAGDYVWDLQMTDASDLVTTLLAGNAVVHRDVTRLP